MPRRPATRRFGKLRHQPLSLRLQTFRNARHQFTQRFLGKTIEKKTRHHRIVFAFWKNPFARIRLMKRDIGPHRQPRLGAGDHRPAGFHAIHFDFRKPPRQFRHKPAIALAHREHALRVRQPRQQIKPTPQQPPPKRRILQPPIRPRQRVKCAAGILPTDREGNFCRQNAGSAGRHPFNLLRPFHFTKTKPTTASAKPRPPTPAALQQKTFPDGAPIPVTPTRSPPRPAPRATTARPTPPRPKPIPPNPTPSSAVRVPSPPSAAPSKAAPSPHRTRDPSRRSPYNSSRTNRPKPPPPKRTAV